MIRFPHIDALYQVVRYVDKTNKRAWTHPDGENFEIISPVRYRGTVKLNGTNAGVICTSGDLIPQSRNRKLTADNDNAGFASFVFLPSTTKAIREIEQKIRQDFHIDPDTKVILYGEWIGPGIQSNTAINKLEEKQWVLFSAKLVDNKNNHKWISIAQIPPLGGQYEQIYSVYDIPTWELEVDFKSQEKKEEALKQAEAYTKEVEDQCPWGKHFGLEGTGEGIVWIPVGKDWGNSDLFFKTKGEKHKGTEKSKKKKSPIDPEILANINEFLDFALTENRLNQGIEYLKEMGHPIDMKSTPHFLKWVGQDVKRECEAELEENNLDWKKVSKMVTARAMEYFKKVAMST